MIDFSNYIVDDIDNEYSNVKYFDFNLIINKNLNMFNTANLSHTLKLTQKKSPICQFLKSKNITKLCSELNLHGMINVNRGNSNLSGAYADSRLFIILLMKYSVKDFLDYSLSLLMNDFDTNINTKYKVDELDKNKLMEKYKVKKHDDVFITSFLDNEFECIICNNMLYISTKSIKCYFESEKERLRPDNFIKYNTEVVNEFKKIFKNDDIYITECHKSYVNILLLIPLLLWFANVDTFSKIDSYIAAHKSKDELNEVIEKQKTCQFSFNNSICEDINEYFVKSKHGEIELIFNKISGYFSASSVGKDINEQKMNKNFHRFFNKDFEKICLILEASPDTENIFTNSSLIPKIKFEHGTYLVYKQSLYSGNTSMNYLTGYYMHPDLFLYFIMWLDKFKFIEYSRLLNVVLQRAAIKNSTLREYYEKQVEKLKKEIIEREKLCEELENQMKEYKKLSEDLITQSSPKRNNYGSIVVNYICNKEMDDNVTKAKINGFNYESLQTKNNTVIRTFGAKDNFEIFKDYICKNDVGYVKLIKNNDFEIADKDKTFKLIDDLISKNIPVHERNSSSFDEEFEMLLNLYNKNQNAYNRGKLFEYVCADKFGAILWKNLTKYYLYTFGLTNQDIGIDLVDIEHKILYQCKNYKTKLNTSNINSFRRTLNIFKSIDKEYVGKIICDKVTIVAKNVLDEFEIIRLDLDEELQ